MNDQSNSAIENPNSNEESMENNENQAEQVDSKTSTSNAELEAANEQIQSLKEQLLRTQADMQNLHRRLEKDVANAHKYGLEKFTMALLPVADSLEKALEHMDTDSTDDSLKALYDGVAMTLTLLTDTFKKFNIEKLDPIGAPFDPNFHEAIAMIDQPDAEPNTVVAVLQKGYSLNGRSIRPAMVTVAKN